MIKANITNEQIVSFVFSDLDGNVIVPNGSKMMEIMHPGYKEHLKEKDF